MKIFNDIYRDLIDKKLWLIALPLAILAIGIPFVVGKPTASTVVATAPSTPTDTDTGPELTLTRASTTGFAIAPRVNTKKLDPFGIRGALSPADKKSADALNSAVSSVVTTSGGSAVDTAPIPSTSNTGSDTPANTGTDTPSTPDTTTPKATTPKTVRDDVISVVVTSDADDTAQQLEDIRTLSPLPDADNPFLVYVGRTGDDEAQFIVASNATASGAGTCSPSPSDCSTLTLAVGQTETFVVTGKDATGAATTTKVSVTLTDLTSKKVPVDDGTDETASAARYEDRVRAIGAKVVKTALKNPDIARALVHAKVKIHRY